MSVNTRKVADVANSIADVFAHNGHTIVKAGAVLVPPEGLSKKRLREHVKTIADQVSRMKGYEDVDITLDLKTGVITVVGPL